MTEPDADTCRPVEIDGETIRVRGRREMTDEERGYLAEVIQAAKRKFAAEHSPARRTADTITDDELDRLYARLEFTEAALARVRDRLEVEVVRQTKRAERTEAAIDRVRTLHQRWDASPGHCAHCITGPGNLVPWPCPTIQALDAVAHDDSTGPSERPHLCPKTRLVGEHMQGCPYSTED